LEKEYWEQYYAAQGPTDQPSNFARFCAARHPTHSGTLIDIGCGNGRDTLFFSSQSLACIGVDQCLSAIDGNNAQRSALKLPVRFLQADFSECDYASLANGPYSIYSRFTLHAINYEEERKLFAHLNGGRKLQHLYIEARSVNDDLYGLGRQVGMHEFVTSHYRRFIDPTVLRTQLEQHFELEYFVEGKDFAKTATENPCLIRVIAKRR
jgi:tellurite methyltransferase